MNTTHTTNGYWDFYDSRRNWRFGEDTSETPTDFENELRALWKCYGEPHSDLQIERTYCISGEFAFEIRYNDADGQSILEYAVWVPHDEE